MIDKRPRDFIEEVGTRKVSAGIGAPVFKGAGGYGGYGNGYTSRAVTAGSNMRRTGDLKTEAPQWYSPLLSFINYYIPWDMATLNQYCRYFDTFHPLVGNCFVEGTPVNMADGTVKNIEEIKVGEEVLNHLSQPRKVTKTFNPKYEGEIFKLKIMGVREEIKVTGEHKFPVIREEEFKCKFKNYKDKNGKVRKSPKRCYFGESGCCKYHECSSNDLKIEQITVEKIKPKDYLITTMNDFVKENDLKIEHAILLGYYAAEGFVNKYRKYSRPIKKYGKDEKVKCKICGKEFLQLGSHICFKHGVKGEEYLKRFPGSKLVSDQESKRIHERAEKKWSEKEYSDKLHKHLKDLNGGVVGNDKVQWCFYRSEEEYIEEIYSCLDNLGLSYTKNYNQVAVSSTELASLCLKHVGKGASTKKLSDDIVYASLEFQKVFLLSYLKGDGHFGKKEVVYVTVSKDLAWQIKFIAERLHIPVSLKEIVPTEGNRKDGWNIVGKHNRWRGVMPRWAFEKVYGGDCKKSLTQSLIRRNIFVDTEHKRIYRQISSIEKETFDGVVYNIEVEKEHTYMVQGVGCFNCISLHTELPLSRFGIKGITDPKIHQFYEDMLDQMNALMLMYDQLREWWLIGEVFTYLYWDDKEGWWSDSALLQPEYVDIIGTPILGNESDYIYKLRFGESIKELFTSGEEGESMKGKLPHDIVEAIETTEAIELDTFNLMIMQRKSPYAIRGSSIVLRALIDLIHETRLREAQMAVAERHIAPKEIWKVGSDSFFPTQEYLQSLSNLILDSTQQPDFKLVVPNVVSYEVVGSAGKFPNIFADLQQIEERVLTALFTNKALTSGVGPTYNNASIGARVLLSRYIPVRQMLENSWKKNVFLPVAVEHDFYEIKKCDLDHGIRRPYKDRTPVIPDFDWQYKANLLDDTNYKNMAINLWDKNLISSKTLCNVFDMDFDYEVEQLLAEQGSVHDKLYQEMRKKVFEEVKTAVKKKGLNIDLKLSDINETNMLIPPEFKKSGTVDYTIPGKALDSITNGQLGRKTKASIEKIVHQLGEKEIERVKKQKSKRKEKNIN